MNFSSVVSDEPFRLAITASGLDKEALDAGQIVLVDSNGQVVEGSGRPSDETPLHLAIARLKSVGSVLHTHSVWGTILSEAHWHDEQESGLAIEGYEMLKGLRGTRTHEHREWVPIIENSQDYSGQAVSMEEALKRHPESHGLLVRRHGLYAWGRDLAEAKRHVEILEFLLEVRGRLYVTGDRREGPRY